VIKRLLALNGLAAVFAVINHAVVWELTVMFWWTDRYLPAGTVDYVPQESWRFFTVGLIDQVVFIAVFIFLFISGFFNAVAAGREQRSVPWKLVFHRVKYLLVPYLIWTLAVLAINLVQGRTQTPWELVKTILLGGASPQYYYVILLVQLYLLSPLLVPFARERWKMLLAITGLLQLLSLAAHYAAILNFDLGRLEMAATILRDWHLLGYAFWFFLGTVIGFHLQEICLRLYRWRWLLVAGMLVTFVIGFLEWGAVRDLSGREWISPQVIFFNRVFVLFALLSFVALDNLRMPFSNTLSKLGQKSYGIYLIHVVPLEITARLVYHIAPQLLAYQFIMMPLLVLAGISIPVVMMEVANRSRFRRYYKYVFG